MAVSRHLEIERKYDVDGAAPLPRLGGGHGATALGEAVVRDHEAVYFDTADLALARRGITLRRRTGGMDEGWHLKLPGDSADGDDARTEVTLPLGTAHAVPGELLDVVRGVVRGHDLMPVARVRTHRLAYPLLGSDDLVLGEICDDTVAAESLVDGDGMQRWREWEVEVAGVAGEAQDLLDSIERLLLKAGARPAQATSKLARTLGRRVARRGRRTGASLHAGRSSAAKAEAGEVFGELLAQGLARLADDDIAVRSEGTDAIHRLRIAARRLRAVLTTCSPLCAPGRTDEIREDLRWLGQSLAGARDAQVLRERLDHVIAAEPAELVVGPVAVRIDDALDSAYREGLERARAALGSEQYFRLLDSLDELASAPQLLPKASRRAAKVFPSLLRRDAKRLRRAVRELESTKDPEQRDAALHEVRKKAKRLRYAAESTAPVLGKDAARLAAAAKRVQDTLGRHQDSVLARDRLREYAAAAHHRGEEGFTYGRLHALEQARGKEAEAAFDEAWTRLSRRIRRSTTR